MWIINMFYCNLVLPDSRELHPLRWVGDVSYRYSMLSDCSKLHTFRRVTY